VVIVIMGGWCRVVVDQHRTRHEMGVAETETRLTEIGPLTWVVEKSDADWFDTRITCVVLPMLAKMF
jgi:hypothetical protein